MLSLETIGYYSDQPGSQQYPAGLGFLYPSTGNFIAFVGNSQYGQLVRDVVRTFRHSEQAVEPFEFDRISGAWWGKVVRDDAKRAVRRSADRYLRAISH